MVFEAIMDQLDRTRGVWSEDEVPIVRVAIEELKRFPSGGFDLLI